MLKTETLKARMLRKTPGSGGSRRFHGKIHLARVWFPSRFGKNYFGSGFSTHISRELAMGTCNATS